MARAANDGSCRDAAAAHRKPRRIGGWRQAEQLDGRPSIVNCTWGYFPQKVRLIAAHDKRQLRAAHDFWSIAQVDHFGDSDATFPQRYCMYSKWWSTAAKGGFKAALFVPIRQAQGLPWYSYQTGEAQAMFPSHCSTRT